MIITKPDTIRGYAREQYRRRQILLASKTPDRPGRVAQRKNTSHSTHWTVPARRTHVMDRLRVDRHWEWLTIHSLPKPNV